MRGQEDQLTHCIDLYSKSCKFNINLFLAGAAGGAPSPAGAKAARPDDL